MSERTPGKADTGAECIADHLPCPYQSLGPDGCFLAVNEAWLRRFGYREEEVIGRPFAEFVEEHHALLFPQRFQAFKKAGATEGVRFDVRAKDGGVLPCLFAGRIEYDADGEMVRTHCLLHEASGQVRLADSLRRSEARQHAVLHAVQEGILLLDGRQRIVQANPAAADLLGAPVQSLAGHALLEFVAEPSQAAARNLLERADRMDDWSEHAADLHLHHADGRLRDLRMTVGALFDEQRRPSGRVVSLVDLAPQLEAGAACRERADLATALLERSEEGILVFDAEHRLAYANRRAAAVHGRAPEQLRDMSPKDILGEEGYGHFRDFLEAAGRGEDYSSRTGGRRADGGIFPAAVRGGVVLLAGRRFFLYAIRDLTEQENMLATLREREAFSQQLFQQTSDGVAVYEAVEDGADFRFRDLNPVVCRHAGASREETIGLSLREVFPKVDEMGLVEALREAWRTREPQDLPLHQYQDERLSLWIESRLLALPSGGILAVYRDLTARKQLEEGLRAGESHLQRLLENMPVLLDAFDAEGVPLVWNRECERVTGYNADEVVGNPQALAWMYPDPEVRRQRLEFQTSGASYRNREWTLRRKDGEYRTLLLSNMSSQFPVPGWASWAIGVDITAYRESERRMESRREELEGRVRERTEELRTMLAAMAGRELRMVELKETIAALLGQLRRAGLQPVADDPLAEEEAP